MTWCLIAFHACSHIIDVLPRQEPVSFSVHLRYVCTRLCLRVCVHLHVYAHARGGQNLMAVPSSRTLHVIDALESGSPLDPELALLTSLASLLTGDPWSLSSPCLDHQQSAMLIWHLHGCWRSELWSSDFCGKCFAQGAVFPAPQPGFFRDRLWNHKFQ